MKDQLIVEFFTPLIDQLRSIVDWSEANLITMSDLIGMFNLEDPIKSLIAVPSSSLEGWWVGNHLD